MRQYTKKILLFIGVFFLCFINISKVNALDIDISDVKVINRNASAKVGETTFKEQYINSKVTLHKVGSYVEYELTLDNNEFKKYNIKKISNNLKNKNIEITYNSEELKENDKAKLNIKIKYNKKIEDSIKNKELELTLNLKEEDNILLYFICIISATIGIVFIITTRKHKRLRLIAASITLIPILILIYWTLDTEKYKIKLNDITVIGYSSSSRSGGDGISSFKVNIDPDNGEEPIERIVDYGDKIGNLPTPTKEGFIFKEWVDENGKTVTENTEVTEDMFVEAKYESLEFKISYELKGGKNNVDNPYTYTITSDNITIKDPNRETYTFVGWTGSNGDEIEKNVTIKTGTNGDLNYIAHYKKMANKLTVLLSFDEATYTGNEIKPKVVVKDGNTVLKEGVDYTLKYENNVDAGQAKVVVVMTNKYNKTTDTTYEGTKTETFTINKVKPEVSVSDKKVTYTGNTITIDKKDVTVSPKSNGNITIKYYSDPDLKNEVTVKDVGTYYYVAEVEETSNYTGAKSKVYTLNVERKKIEIPEQKDDEIITYNGKEQVLRTDTEYYTVSGEVKGKDVGEYTIEVKPTSNYVWPDGTTEPKTITVNITPYDISNSDIETISNIVYDGTSHTPTPSVSVPLPSTDNPTTLTDNDYTYSYTNNKNAGTATVTIKGKGNYTGENHINFTIDKATGYISLSENNKTIKYGTDKVVFDITDNHGGEFTVSDDNSISTETVNDNHITINNLETVPANTSIAVTVTCKESNNYLSASATYTINVEKATPIVTISNNNFVYDENDFELPLEYVIVTPNSGGTKSVKYYSDSNLQNEVVVHDVGTYYVVASISETDNYTSATSDTITLTIDRMPISVPTQSEVITYNKSEQTLMTSTRYYTVSGTTKGTNAGNYDVTVTPTSNYKWEDGTTSSKQTRVVISPYNISSATVSPITDKTYNGSNQTPTPSVSVPLPSIDNPTTLTSSDTTYTYENNKNAGTATVTITGKGNYTGSVSSNFTINKANGYINLSDNSKNSPYGNNSITFNITSNHGGNINITTDHGSVSRNNNTVTVTGLNDLDSGDSVHVSLVCEQTSNYKKATANFTVNITNAAIIDGDVNITGNNIVGETLTANVTDTLPVANYSYQWYRNDSDSNQGGTAISGANSSTYVITESDIGKYLYVKVEATKENYDGKTMYAKTSTTDNKTSKVAKTTTIPTSGNYCKSISYTGSYQTLTKTAATGYYFTNNSGKNVGSYTVAAKLSDNYIWNDLSFEDKNITCSISSTGTTTTLSNTSFTYDGNSKSVSSYVSSRLNSNSSSVSGSYTIYYYNGTSCQGTASTSAPINAGNYSAKAILSGTSNYNSSTSSCATITINKKDATCTSSSDSKEYDGTPLTASGGTCTGLLSGHTATITNSGSATTPADTSTGNNTISSVTIKDSSNNNVTNNYEITNVNGTLTITPKSVSCTSNSSSKIYDGTALTASGGTCTGLLSGHSATINTSGSITNVSQTSTGNNTISSVTIKDSSNNNVTSYYSVSKNPGTLTITPKSITCTSNSATKIYDGTPLTASGGTCTGLLSGHNATFTNSGSSNTVYRLLGDVDNNGVVNDADVTLLRQDLANWDVALPAPDNADFDQNGIVNIADATAINQYLAGWNTILTTPIGDVDNTISSVSISNGSSNVTSNYSITKVPGKLRITPKSITVTSGSASKTYDGTALTSNACSVTSGSLLSGETISCTNSGSQTNAGSTTNKISTISIMKGSTNTRSFYNVTRVNGTLTVNPKSITCTSSSAEKVYDGTPLTASGGTCTGLVSGHTATFSNSGVSNTIYRLLGDVDFDGDIDDDDVTLLKQELARWHVALPAPNNADFNQDGDVTVKDTTLMTQYIAGWNISVTTPIGNIDNTISSITISNGSTNVTNNYDITTVAGKLKIWPTADNR